MPSRRCPGSSGRGNRVAHLRARAAGARRPRRVGRGARGRAASVRELAALDEYYEPASRVALHHLERHLFEPSPPRVEAGEVVGLLEAGGERAEAELIASEVLAALRDGVPASEVVVVCRSLRRSGPLLLRTLRRYGVPAAGAIRSGVTHTALGRALLALARCAFSPDALASDVLAYLRAPGLLDSPAGVDALAAELARRGLVVGRGRSLAGSRHAIGLRSTSLRSGIRPGRGARAPRTPAAGGVEPRARRRG